MSQPTPPEHIPDAETLDAAKVPVASGILPLLGVIWALALIGLGVALIREVLVHANAVSGSLWAAKTVTYLNDRPPTDWMVPAGVAAALLGLVLVVLALRPRARKELAVSARTGVFLTTASVRRLAESAAADVDGVDTTSVSASRSKVVVDVTTLSADSADTKSRIELAVQAALASLTTQPTIKVKVLSVGGGS